MLTYLESITDQGIAALVSNNRNLDDIELRDCKLLTNASMLAIAESCHNLRRISLTGPMTDQGFVALVSNNHDLEYIDMEDCTLLTENGVDAALDQHCGKLKCFTYPRCFCSIK